MRKKKEKGEKERVVKKERNWIFLTVRVTNGERERVGRNTKREMEIKKEEK